MITPKPSGGQVDIERTAFEAWISAAPFDRCLNRWPSPEGYPTPTELLKKVQVWKDHEAAVRSALNDPTSKKRREAFIAAHTPISRPSENSCPAPVPQTSGEVAHLAVRLNPNDPPSVGGNRLATPAYGVSHPGSTCETVQGMNAVRLPG